MVSGLISLLSPPMIPARQEGASRVGYDQHLVGEGVLGAVQSGDLLPILGAADDDLMCRAMSRRSNACMGWPVSSMTKLVMSTMLLIGRIPAALRQRFIQSGEGAMRRLLHRAAHSSGGRDRTSSTLTR